MPTVREIMTSNVECIKEDATVAEAARRMRDLDIGALPICGADDKLKGVITDRDIAVSCVAAGQDPSSTPVSQFAQGVPLMVNVEDSVDDALQLMADNQVRRLPVLEDKQLVGIVSQADIARTQSPEQVGTLVASISSTTYGLAA